MAKSMRLFSSAFIVILLLVAIEMAPKVAEAADTQCQNASGKFKGTCMISSNCASVCKTEGYTGGKCQGFRMKCYCTKPGNCK